MLFGAPEIGAQGLLAKCYYEDYTRLDPKMLKRLHLRSKGRRKLVRAYRNIRNTSLILN